MSMKKKERKKSLPPSRLIQSSVYFLSKIGRKRRDVDYVLLIDKCIHVCIDDNEIKIRTVKVNRNKCYSYEIIKK